MDNVNKIWEIESNNKCADCGTAIDSNNGWASISFGVCICVDCAGLHRNIAGNQIKSFLLDTSAWKDSKNVDFLLQIRGNASANTRVWECHLPHFFINPKIDDLSLLNDTDKESTFRKFLILNKYEEQLFTPLRMKDYFTSKNQSIFDVPFETKFSFNAGGKQKTAIQFYNLYGKNKWSKKPLFICIHSSYLSFYPNSKITKRKNQHIKSLNLIPLKITINNMDDDKYNNDEEDWYEFQIMEDEAHLFEFQYFKQEEHNEPLLRARTKDFDVFVQYVHELRKVAAYYRMYNGLVKVDTISNPSLDVSYADFNKKNTVIGLGNVFGASKKSHFYVLEDRLYVFNVDPFSGKAKTMTATYAWNLQKIDLKQDKNGDRTGIKHSLLIIEPDKMLSVKFENARISDTFCKRLLGIWTEMHGSFLVDFKDVVPVILDESMEDSLMQDVSRAPRKSAMIKVDYSQVKNAALNKQRPPEILEILAKMEKIPLTPISGHDKKGLPAPLFDLEDDADGGAVVEEVNNKAQQSPRKKKTKFKKRAEPLSPHNEVIIMPHPHIKNSSSSPKKNPAKEPIMAPLQLMQSRSVSITDNDAHESKADGWDEDAIVEIEHGNVQIAVNGAIHSAQTSPKKEPQKAPKQKMKVDVNFNNAFNSAFDAALGGAKTTPLVNKSAKWKCTRCTYFNDSWDPKCAICGLNQEQAKMGGESPLPTPMSGQDAPPGSIRKNKPRAQTYESVAYHKKQVQQQQPSQDQPLPRPQYNGAPRGAQPGGLPGLPRPQSRSPSPPREPRLSLPRPPQPLNMSYPLAKPQPQPQPQPQPDESQSSSSSNSPEKSPSPLPTGLPNLPLDESSSNHVPEQTQSAQPVAPPQDHMHMNGYGSQPLQRPILPSSQPQPVQSQAAPPQPAVHKKPSPPQPDLPTLPDAPDLPPPPSQPIASQPANGTYAAPPFKAMQQQGPPQQMPNQQQTAPRQAVQSTSPTFNAMQQQHQYPQQQYTQQHQAYVNMYRNPQAGSQRFGANPQTGSQLSFGHPAMGTHHSQSSQHSHHSGSGSQRSFNNPQNGSQRSFGNPQPQPYGSQTSFPNVSPHASQTSFHNNPSPHASQTSFHNNASQTSFPNTHNASPQAGGQPQHHSLPNPQAAAQQQWAQSAHGSQQHFANAPNASPQQAPVQRPNKPRSATMASAATYNQNAYNQHAYQNGNYNRNMYNQNQNYNQNMNGYGAQPQSQRNLFQQQQQQQYNQQQPQQQQPQSQRNLFQQQQQQQQSQRNMYNQQQQQQQQYRALQSPQHPQQHQYNNAYGQYQGSYQQNQYGSQMHLGGGSGSMQQQQYMFKKRKSGAMMHHIKLERYFIMTDAQKTNITTNINWVQTMLGKYATIELKQEIGCYKLTIPSHVPMPNRKAFWKNVLKTMRNNCGMSQERLML